MPSVRPSSNASEKGDALDRELASLAETTSMSNPLTFGHRSDWQTSKRVDEATMKRESEIAKALPKTFVLTEPRQHHGAFAVAAKAAAHPAQPMRPNRLSDAGASSTSATSNKALTKGGSASCSTGDSAPSSSSSSAIVVATAPRARVPPAKRSHMDGVLRGMPGDVGPVRSTQTDAFVHDDEMNAMNEHKDLAFHRKRDAYSDYVEARARFSKMHSVN